MSKENLFAASREALNIDLKAKEGTLPNDLSGIVFINSGCGSINSDGLPFPRTTPDGKLNKEYGAPLINGDGYMFRFDFTQAGKVTLKTDILKPPCYYADLASSPIVSGPDNPYADLAFKNNGLARLSMVLGTRNQLNTAITPFKLKGETHNRLLATFDAGRPFEFDPESMALITPIGENKFWHPGTPPMMNNPFPMVLTTAHPVYDPDTQELFTVNFTKTTKALMSATSIFKLLWKSEDKLEAKLLERIARWEKMAERSKVVQEVNDFFGHLEKHVDKHEDVELNLWEKIEAFFRGLMHRITSNPNAVYLIKWQGEKTPKKWEITDEKGKGIQIMHNMHQIGFSKDYVILADTNFKFTLNVMLNNPFPHNERIDAFLRTLLSGAQLDYSSLYIVKRSELVERNKKVKAKKIHLPTETVHFSVNYEDTDGLITLHTAHNSSACPAEWIRYYDKRKADGNPIDLEMIGLLAVGEMDIGRIGKIVVDAKKGTVAEDKTTYLHLEGKPGEKDTGAHTWGVGLYTYNGMLSADYNVKEIKHIFWQAYGLHESMLTEFVFNLYKDPKRSRIFSAEQMLEFTKKGAPFVLECIETDGMTATDYYLFPKGYYMWSLQFVPRSKRDQNKPESLDGYILCTVMGEKRTVGSDSEYFSEIWLFDAADLKSGPVCKLHHEKLIFAFTIHSVWVPNAQETTQPNYKLNTQSDYNDMVSKILRRKLRRRVQKLMDDHVYPHF